MAHILKLHLLGIAVAACGWLLLSNVLSIIDFWQEIQGWEFLGAEQYADRIAAVTVSLRRAQLLAGLNLLLAGGGGWLFRRWWQEREMAERPFLLFALLYLLVSFALVVFIAFAFFPAVPVGQN